MSIIVKHLCKVQNQDLNSATVSSVGSPSKVNFNETEDDLSRPTNEYDRNGGILKNLGKVISNKVNRVSKVTEGIEKELSEQMKQYT